MDKINIETATYYVSSLQGYSLSEAMRHWKAKFDSLARFQKEVITHPSLEPLSSFVTEMWDSIRPVEVTEALAEKNLERRRVMFDCIGVAKLFAALQPELLDRQVISKKRTRWDLNNEAYQHDYQDAYELYRIDRKKLFGTDGNTARSDAFAVRCWCTTTAREYWIYVPSAAAYPNFDRWAERQTGDAIAAIAWTIVLDITDPECIYRQGDIIVAKKSKSSKPTTQYHLNSEQYLKLMYSET